MLVMRSVSAPKALPADRTGRSTPALPGSITAQLLTNFLRRPQKQSGKAERPVLAPFEIVARSKGQVVLSQWLEGQDPHKALLGLLEAAPIADLLQLSMVCGRKALAPDSWRRVLAPACNGRMGLELSLNGEIHRVSPLETIATNRPLRRWFEKWLEARALTDHEFFKLGGQMVMLDCRQFLISAESGWEAVESYRANLVVDPGARSLHLAEDVISGIARWFMANLGADGALPYKYWPSAGVYSQADNPIRAFMASVVFNRLAESLGRQDVGAAARRNLAYNMNRFYATIEGDGAIFWNGSVKLGALAIAGQAIIESPFGLEWKEQLSAIRATIDKLWQPSGAFRTFLVPRERNDNQNFYPGETLVFWATSLAQKHDDELLGRALKSLQYYRRHFRSQPNPAFVPWHSQAAAILYKLTGELELRDYVFEMNDWLMPHQQWGGDLEPDHWGRFYNPAMPEYGPPHASATGVYLEGLVDALALAREAKDEVREHRYLQAIERGIRSVAQLQFRGSLDAYYIHHQARVIGAIRTESDNNEIRIDNMQHALAALLKFTALEKSRFSQGTGRGRAERRA